MVGENTDNSADRGWLATALIRAGTLASSTAVIAAVLTTPVAAQPDSADPADPPANATQVQQRDLTVEALGDSFFTGLGAGAYQRPDARRQSQAAGFLQALARLEAANPGLNVTVQNHSSAGATIDNLYDSQMAGGLLGGNMPINAPQLEGVNPNADLAIMGFGGNDAGFVDAIMSTFGDDAPLQNMVAGLLAGQLDVTRPAADYMADAARPRGQQQTLVGELVRGIQAAQAAMPNAKIVVTTYPEAVDPAATNRLSVISSAELAAFGQLGEALNEAIRQAAALAGATVADNSEAFAGHEVYTDEPYLHDLGPQWRRDDRDEAMHPNAAGHTALADAIADAVSRVTGLNPAAPYAGPDPYPTDGITQLPGRPSRPTRSLPDTPTESKPAPDNGAENPKPDKINWTGGVAGAEQPGAEPGAEPGQQPGEQPSDEPGAEPSEPDEPTLPVVPPSPAPPSPAPPAPEPGPGAVAPGDTNPPPSNESDAGGGAADTPDGSDRGANNNLDPADNPDTSDNTGPADNPENGGDRGTGTSNSVGPADNPENGGDRGTGTHESVGPADNPENGGDRGTGTSNSVGPADNPENGGDRGTGTHESVGPADNPENGGDRGTGTSNSVGPADNPENGGDRGTGNSGSVGSSGNGGDHDSGSSGGSVSSGDHGGSTGSDNGTGWGGGNSDSSGSDSNSGNSGNSGNVGPADNPDNGGDRGTSTHESVGPADNPDNGGDRGTGTHDSMGPADNPENGGDRGSPDWGGSGVDPSTPMS